MGGEFTARWQTWRGTARLIAAVLCRMAPLLWHGDCHKIFSFGAPYQRTLTTV